MSSPVQESVREHVYDGIEEYDNPTPGWWWLIFALTVVFSCVYFGFFQFSPVAWTSADEHDADRAENLRLRFGEIGDLNADEPTLLIYMAKPEWLLVGKSVFAANCARCHGSDGAGSVGPNLTDDHWKNVKKLADVAFVIANGAANGAMPPWRDLLHPNEVVLTAAYVASLRGQHLPGPRGAEGNVIPPWPALPPVEKAEGE